MDSEASATGFDRREYHRVRYYADVEIEWGPTILRGRSSDISADGMMVETKTPLPEGTEFRARIYLGGEPLEAECTVRNVVPSGGMGVAFTELKPTDQARLRKLLSALPH